MTRPWGQKMFVAGSGGGWGSASPPLGTLRGKQLMTRSKGQRAGLTTAALQTMLSLRAWCDLEGPGSPQAQDSPPYTRHLELDQELSNMSEILDNWTCYRSAKPPQVISTDVSVRLM